MKAISAKATAGLNLGSILPVIDNSGARIAKIVGVKKGGGTKGRQGRAKIGDMVNVAVKKGKPDVKGQVFLAVIVRQRKPYRRNDGGRIAFEDNAVAIVKDEKGFPKGTQIKGPVAREVVERWPQVAKIASIVY